MTDLVSSEPACVDEVAWHVYVLACGDGSLYTGIAKDVCSRFMQHLSGKGAAYTRSHIPVRVLASRELSTKGAALRAELAIKRLPRAQKLAFFADHEVWADEAEVETVAAPRG